jgi:hypothetical protein
MESFTLPTRTSLVLKGPYTSAVSRNVTLAWTANLMSSISFSSYFGSPEYGLVVTMHPNPVDDTSNPLESSFNLGTVGRSEAITDVLPA